MSEDLVLERSSAGTRLRSMICGGGEERERKREREIEIGRERERGRERESRDKGGGRRLLSRMPSGSSEVLI